MEFEKNGPFRSRRQRCPLPAAVRKIASEDSSCGISSTTGLYLRKRASLFSCSGADEGADAGGIALLAQIIQQVLQKGLQAG